MAKSKKAQSEPPKVPKLPTLSPKKDLVVTEVEPRQIYLIHDFFTAKECNSLIQHFETHLPLQQVSTTPRPGEAFRSNDRQSFEDPIFAQRLWQLGLDKVCRLTEGIQGLALPRQPVGLNSNLRIYRYRPGQMFQAHYDESVKDAASGLWTEWTLLIYLNEEMEGGETVFYKSVSKRRLGDPIVVQPQQGMALLHAHDKNCMLHEGKEVKKGVKWVLRSDVLVG
ncbi:hypothetical protein J3Q64DRAFT_1709801 [Phycomyces blakesleeanus]|uniref:Fe2OG dioxygenase domain-containing protein n=2 Tax=Phycomyces blakesleeanus TaxID=4837 RepID=A0ABR3BDC0_PHYBL